MTRQKENNGPKSLPARLTILQKTSGQNQVGHRQNFHDNRFKDVHNHEVKQCKTGREETEIKQRYGGEEHEEKSDPQKDNTCDGFKTFYEPVFDCNKTGLSKPCQLLLKISHTLDNVQDEDTKKKRDSVSIHCCNNKEKTVTLNPVIGDWRKNYRTENGNIMRYENNFPSSLFPDCTNEFNNLLMRVDKDTEESSISDLNFLDPNMESQWNIQVDDKNLEKHLSNIFTSLKIEMKASEGVDQEMLDSTLQNLMNKLRTKLNRYQFVRVMEAIGTKQGGERLSALHDFLNFFSTGGDLNWHEFNKKMHGEKVGISILKQTELNSGHKTKLTHEEEKTENEKSVPKETENEAKIEKDVNETKEKMPGSGDWDDREDYQGLVQVAVVDDDVDAHEVCQGNKHLEGNDEDVENQPLEVDETVLETASDDEEVENRPLEVDETRHETASDDEESNEPEIDKSLEESMEKHFTGLEENHDVTTKVRDPTVDCLSCDNTETEHHHELENIRQDIDNSGCEENVATAEDVKEEEAKSFVEEKEFLVTSFQQNKRFMAGYGRNLTSQKSDFSERCKKKGKPYLEKGKAPWTDVLSRGDVQNLCHSSDIIVEEDKLDVRVTYFRTRSTMSSERDKGGNSSLGGRGGNSSGNWSNKRNGGNDDQESWNQKDDFNNEGGNGGREDMSLPDNTPTCEQVSCKIPGQDFKAVRKKHSSVTDEELIDLLGSLSLDSGPCIQEDPGLLNNVNHCLNILLHSLPNHCDPECSVCSIIHSQIGHMALCTQQYQQCSVCWQLLQLTLHHVHLCIHTGKSTKESSSDVCIQLIKAVDGQAEMVHNRSERLWIKMKKSVTKVLQLPGLHGAGTLGMYSLVENEESNFSGLTSSSMGSGDQSMASSITSTGSQTFVRSPGQSIVASSVNGQFCRSGSGRIFQPSLSSIPESPLKKASIRRAKKPTVLLSDESISSEAVLWGAKSDDSSIQENQDKASKPGNHLVDLPQEGFLSVLNDLTGPASNRSSSLGQVEDISMTTSLSSSTGQNEDTSGQSAEEIIYRRYKNMIDEHGNILINSDGRSSRPGINQDPYETQKTYGTVGVVSLPIRPNIQEREQLFSLETRPTGEPGIGEVVYGTRRQIMKVARHWAQIRGNMDTESYKHQLREEGVILDSAKKHLRILGPHYQKKHQWVRLVHLGNGVAGKCHLARDATSGFKFCVKRVHIAKYEENELLTWSGLDHDNIVKLYGAIRHGCKIYIFCEFIAGGSLTSLINEQRSLNRRLSHWICLRYFQQLLRVLVYLKSRNILHEDLKADNILIRQSTTLIAVTDFGLARSMNADSEMKGMSPIGSQTQWSPEKATSMGHGFAADVWAAVCILVHMLGGHPPWTQRFPGLQMLHFVIFTKSPPLQDVPKNIQEVVRDLITQGFTIDATLRPSASELLEHQAFRILDQGAPDTYYSTLLSSGQAIPNNLLENPDQGPQELKDILSGMEPSNKKTSKPNNDSVGENYTQDLGAGCNGVRSVRKTDSVGVSKSEESSASSTTKSPGTDTREEGNLFYTQQRTSSIRSCQDEASSAGPVLISHGSLPVTPQDEAGAFGGMRSDSGANYPNFECLVIKSLTSDPGNNNSCESEDPEDLFNLYLHDQVQVHELRPSYQNLKMYCPPARESQTRTSNRLDPGTLLPKLSELIENVSMSGIRFETSDSLSDRGEEDEVKVTSSISPRKQERREEFSPQESPILVSSQKEPLQDRPDQQQQQFLNIGTPSREPFTGNEYPGQATSLRGRANSGSPLQESSIGHESLGQTSEQASHVQKRPSNSQTSSRESSIESPAASAAVGPASVHTSPVQHRPRNDGHAGSFGYESPSQVTPVRTEYILIKSPGDARRVEDPNPTSLSYLTNNFEDHVDSGELFGDPSDPKSMMNLLSLNNTYQNSSNDTKGVNRSNEDKDRDIRHSDSPTRGNVSAAGIISSSPKRRHGTICTSSLETNMSPGTSELNKTSLGSYQNKAEFAEEIPENNDWRFAIPRSAVTPSDSVLNRGTPDYAFEPKIKDSGSIDDIHINGIALEGYPEQPPNNLKKNPNLTLDVNRIVSKSANYHRVISEPALHDQPTVLQTHPQTCPELGVLSNQNGDSSGLGTSLPYIETRNNSNKSSEPCFQTPERGRQNSTEMSPCTPKSQYEQQEKEFSALSQSDIQSSHGDQPAMPDLFEGGEDLTFTVGPDEESFKEQLESVQKGILDEHADLGHKYQLLRSDNTPLSQIRVPSRYEEWRDIIELVRTAAKQSGLDHFTLKYRDDRPVDYDDSLTCGDVEIKVCPVSDNDIMDGVIRCWCIEHEYSF